jgi:hypothetical protein
MTSAAKRGLGFWLKRIALVAAGVFGLVLVAFIAYNQIDEAPSPLAIEMRSDARVIADEDNAWLALIGVEAAPDQSPLDFARAWVAHHANPAAGEWPAQTQISAEFAVHGFTARCDVKRDECLSWLGARREGVLKLARARAAQLKRFERLLSLQHWQALLTPTLTTPAPPGFETAIFYIDIQGAELAHAIDNQHWSNARDRLANLHRVALFWSRVAQQSNNLLTAIIACTSIHRAQRLAAATIDRIGVAKLSEVQVGVGAVLSVEFSVNWHSAMAGEHRLFVAAVDDAMNFSNHQDFNGWVQALAMRLTFAPQASANRHAELMQLSAEVMSTPPTERASASARLSEVYQLLAPPLDDARALPGYFAHNATGKILLSIAAPAFLRYSDRFWDFEAERRAQLLKHHAIVEAIDVTQLDTFLDGQPAALRNPINGQAFDYDPLRNAIRFGLLADEWWMRDALDVKIEPAPPAIVVICRRQGAITLTSAQAQPVVFRSCGSNHPALIDEPDSIEPNHQFNAFFVLWRSDGKRAVVQVAKYDDENNWLSYEATIEPGQTLQALRPVGHEHPLHVDVQWTEPQRHESWVQIFATEPRSVQVWATDIGRAIGERPHGIDRLKPNPVSINTQARVATIYAMLADMGEAELVERNGRFAFR